MKRRPALLVAVGWAAVIVWSTKGASSPVDAWQNGDKPALSSPASPFRLLGAGSCAAAACHGHQQEPRTGGSEYTVWAARDKHAQAYQALFQPSSANMMRHLDPTRKAHEYSLCLSCHVHPQFDMVRSRAEFFK